MPDVPGVPPPLPEPLVEERPGRDCGKPNKKKNKVRSAWISFVGRIIAQLSGAAATIIVGLAVVSEYASVPGGASAAAASSPAVASIGLRPAEARGGIPMAVLPLEYSSSDPAGGSVADAITESVMVNLARIEGVHVVSRTSSVRFAGGEKPLPEVAAQLGVELIVEGVVVLADDRIRVIVQLVDAVADQHLWVQSYERARGDVLTLQAEMSAAIAHDISATIRPAVRERLAGRARIDPKLYEQYIQGRQAVAQRTGPGFQEALRHFEEAIRIDPTFAPAHAGLASTYVLLGLPLHVTWAPDGALALARSAAVRALDLDPTLAEAQAALAAVLHRLDRDWAGAEAAYRRAIALNPGDGLPRQWYSIFLAEQGRHREALAEAEVALARGPLFPDAHNTLGLVHYYARRFDRAIVAARHALDLDPVSVPARLILARSLVELGDESGAIAVCESRSWPAGLDDMLAVLSDAYRRSGDRARADSARQELLSLESASPAAMARLYASSGELDAAFDVLNWAIGHRSAFVTALEVDPLFARLRRDPRFATALERLRLR